MPGKQMTVAMHKSLSSACLAKMPRKSPAKVRCMAGWS
jgi:hypothetical protein